MDFLDLYDSKKILKLGIFPETMSGRAGFSILFPTFTDPI